MGVPALTSVTPNTLRMEPVVLLLLSLVLSTTGQGAAAQSKPGLDKLSLLLGGIFSICDSDGEEGLSFQELKICKEEKTEELKTLGPNVLQRPDQERFKKADFNQDGVLTLEEMTRAAMARLERRNRNNY